MTRFPSGDTINRRDAIKLGFTAASTLAGIANSSSAVVQQEKKRPNILIVMCDQLSASAVSCYGGWVPTPNLERIARRGVTFTNATCPTPFCSPSRASLITGQYPHRHGIVYNVMRVDYPSLLKWTPSTEQGITANDVTTEKLLNASGYATHHYGKWHLSDSLEGLPYYPDTYGEHLEYEQEMAAVFQKVRALPRARWMDWWGTPLPVIVSPAYQEAAEIHWEKGQKVFKGGLLETTDPSGIPYIQDFISKAGRLNLPSEQVFDYRVAERTIRKLGSLGPDPFMITCSLIWPHDPNVVPSPYYNSFDPNRIELPANFGKPERRFESEFSSQIVTDLVGEAGLRELLRIYAGCVCFVDEQVGRVLDALEKTGRADDTIVVFTADHGDMAGGHGMFWKSTTAFYDEVARVPLLISYPRSIKPGRSNLAASLVDIMPTLLDLAGHPIPDGVQGHSLAPYLLGKRDPASAPPYRFSERVTPNPEHTRHVAPGTRGSFMIRGEGWKYVRYPDGEEFLYNLAQDPGEKKNLATQLSFSDQKTHLKRELDTWLLNTGYPQA